jgi:DNA-binding protein H-NS
MKSNELEAMSTDDLWALHEDLVVQLDQRIRSEKARLEERLRKLGQAETAAGLNQERRAYPPVFPKYQNPKNPSETWSGRGKQPRWLIPQIRAGKKLDDFLIRRASGQKQHGRAAR